MDIDFAVISTEGRNLSYVSSIQQKCAKFTFASDHSPSFILPRRGGDTEGARTRGRRQSRIGN